jgi:hypothetical protein
MSLTHVTDPDPTSDRPVTLNPLVIRRYVPPKPTTEHWYRCDECLREIAGAGLLDDDCPHCHGYCTYLGERPL